MKGSKTASLKRACTKPSLKDILIVLTKTGKRTEKQSVIYLFIYLFIYLLNLYTVKNSSGTIPKRKFVKS